MHLESFTHIYLLKPTISSIHTTARWSLITNCAFLDIIKNPMVQKHYLESDIMVLEIEPLIGFFWDSDWGSLKKPDNPTADGLIAMTLLAC